MTAGLPKSNFSTLSSLQQSSDRPQHALPLPQTYTASSPWGHTEFSQFSSFTTLRVGQNSPEVHRDGQPDPQFLSVHPPLSTRWKSSYLASLQRQLLRH